MGAGRLSTMRCSTVRGRPRLFRQTCSRLRPPDQPTGMVYYGTLPPTVMKRSIRSPVLVDLVGYDVDLIQTYQVQCRRFDPATGNHQEPRKRFQLFGEVGRQERARSPPCALPHRAPSFRTPVPYSPFCFCTFRSVWCKSGVWCGLQERGCGMRRRTNQRHRGRRRCPGRRAREVGMPIRRRCRPTRAVPWHFDYPWACCSAKYGPLAKPLGRERAAVQCDSSCRDVDGRLLQVARRAEDFHRADTGPLNSRVWQEKTIATADLTLNSSFPIAVNRARQMKVRGCHSL